MVASRVVFLPKGASIHDRYLKSRRRWCAKGIAEHRTQVSRVQRARRLRQEELARHQAAAARACLCGGRGRVWRREGPMTPEGSDWLEVPCPHCSTTAKGA